MEAEFNNQLKAQFGENLKVNEPLSKHCTLGVGGPAELFVSVNDKHQMQAAVKLALQFKTPFFILGKGSNIVISDLGIKGLVIQNNILTFEKLDQYLNGSAPVYVTARHEHVDKSLEVEQYGLSWNEKTPTQILRLGSGWKLMVAISKCVEQGLTGLEWFFGIAGSVGGAVYMNVHGGARQLFSHFLSAIEIINENGEVEIIPADKLEFDYDYSLFHKRKVVITDAVIRLYRGDKTKAQQVIEQWGRNKIIKQPQRSCGCMFQNLDKKRQDELNLPTPSMGYIIDKVLNLAGTKIGGAQISTKHCAFIENLGDAQAADVKELVDLVKQKTQAKFGFVPQLEVEFIGQF